ESLVIDQGLLKKVYFPREILPLSAVVAGLLDLAAGTLTLIVVAALYGIGPAISWIALPIPMIIAVLTCAAFGLCASALNTYYREYHGSLREDLVQGLGRLVGRHPRRRRVVPALDHVDLEVPEGDSFALIGENGAGKSTALKVATRITYPTSGVVRVRGRVGALVEVGTGLHPELTGRENIELFGS